jgi:hypothetical protein
MTETNLNTSIGTKIYICATPTEADDESTYAGLTWVQIKGAGSIPEFGDAAGEITFPELDSGRVRKFKGAYDAGNLQIPVGHDPYDPGQAAALAAVGTPYNYPFKIVFADAKSDSFTNSVSYFQAKVMSFKAKPGDTNAITQRNLSISIDSDIVYVKSASA